MLIFVIFVTIPRVTKFSTHEIFHPRIFSRLLRIGLRESRNLKPRKLILKTRDSFSRKFAPPKITRYTVYKICVFCGDGRIEVLHLSCDNYVLRGGGGLWFIGITKVFDHKKFHLSVLHTKLSNPTVHFSIIIVTWHAR